LMQDGFENAGASAQAGPRRLGYLCGAPRVSTLPEAEASGPRAHVLGTIGGFNALGWEVTPFIAGDRVPARWRSSGAQQALTRHWSRRLAADVVRLAMSRRSARQAWREIGPNVELVYERFGAFQALGRRFQKARVPWILETNGLLWRESREDRRTIMLASFAKRLELRAYRQCDVLVCISAALRELLVEQATVAREKIVVVPNGVDTRRFDPDRTEPRRLSDRFVIGWVGEMYAWSGLDTLLRALAEVREQGFAIDAVLVGDGSERRAYEQLAADLGVDDAVHWPGKVRWDEVPGYITGFDVCYSGQVPARIGSMYLSPLKLYEYGAMGKPTIASAFDDARALIEGGPSGWLFEPGEVASLAQRLRDAYTQRDTFPARAADIRARVEAHHSWQARVRQMMQDVERILGQRADRHEIRTGR
jgi:glycosyltransferase involved in cell wall biosynthesis